MKQLGRSLVAKALLPEPKPESQPLHRRVARAKARWVSRVMYSDIPAMQRVFAFVVSDHLNCVTLDAWPAQGTVATRLHCCIKTVARAADGLEKLGLIVIERPRDRGLPQRYAPVFAPVDWVTPVHLSGQGSLEDLDKTVHQSSLDIHLKLSEPTARCRAIQDLESRKYKPAERGRWEAEIAKKIGANGLEVLERLNEINEHIVERLCRALCDGELGDQELEAARLAVLQAGLRRS